MTDTYKIDHEGLTVIRTDAHGEAYDLNASGEACQTPGDLRAFVCELCAEGAFGESVRDALLGQVGDAYETATITDRQIETLRTEADAAGDLEQVAVCLVALGDDPSDAEPGTALAGCGLTQTEARAECARVIADAEAMGE